MSAHIETAADVFLEVLGAIGIPGTGLAQYAIRAIKGLRESAEAKAELAELLQKAEEDFIGQAGEQGLSKAAGWVQNMPQHDRPAFRQAVEILLTQWDEGALQSVLEEELAGLAGIPSTEAARAAALYMTVLRGYLIRHPWFNTIITSPRILAIDRRTEEMQAQFDALYRAVTILLGLPEDILVWPAQEPPERSLRATILHPKYRLIPYAGEPFEDARDELVRWARGLAVQEVPPVGVRIYTAPGGHGKTRLFIEAGAILRKEGWWVGFLPAGTLTEQNARLLMADARPTLLAVDYAADREVEVQILLTAAAKAVREERRKAPLAVVLLERTFPEWLNKLLHRASDPSAVDWPEFVRLPGIARKPLELPTFSGPQDRLAFFEGARDQLSYWAAGPEAALPRAPVTYREEALPEAPLYLSLLALHAAAGRRLPAPSDEEAILEYTWQHEKEAWERCLTPWATSQGVHWAVDDAVELLEKLAVLATLGRPFPDAPALAGFCREHFAPIRGADGRTLDLEMLAGQLPQVFPQAEGSLVPPIEPDPLADYVLRQVLPKEEGLIELALPAEAEVEADPVAWAARSWTLFETLMRRWGSAAGEEERQIEGWVRRATEALEERTATAPRAFWAALDARLPRWTILLRRLHVLTAERLLAMTPQEDEGERAELLNSLAVDCIALGMRGKALECIEEAVKIYRDLSQRRGNFFLADLAMSLSNLGMCYHELGRVRDALIPAKEAVDIFRSLAGQNPETFRPDLATAYNNLSVYYRDMGEVKLAIQTATRGLQLYRQLAEKASENFLPGLATILSNIAGYYSQLGNASTALPYSKESLEIYRQLAEQNPDAFLPDLGGNLNNQALILLKLGHYVDALPLVEEAVDIQARLVRQHPGVFQANLCRFLINLIECYFALGQFDKAAKLCRDLAEQDCHDFLPGFAANLTDLSLRLHDQGKLKDALLLAIESANFRCHLADQNPEAFLPDLAKAKSLTNVAVLHHKLGSVEEALATARKAATTCFSLASQSAGTSSPDLAASLTNLAALFRELGQREEALGLAEKAIAIYLRLEEENPDAFLPALARSQTNLAKLLSELGRWREALGPAQEATANFRRLTKMDPENFLPALAGSLTDLSNCFRELGKQEEALDAAQEAVDFYRRLTEEAYEANAPYLAGSMNNLSVSLSDLGRREEALAPAQEAVDLCRRLEEENPQAFLPNLAMSLNNLANRLSESGQREEALAPAQEAVDLYRRLAEENPQAFASYLAISLGNLAEQLSGVGRHKEALSQAQEAVQTLAPFFAGLPPAYAGWMKEMLRIYLHICEEVGAPPALALPPAVREELETVAGDSALPAEIRELARRLLGLAGD